MFYSRKLLIELLNEIVPEGRFDIVKGYELYATEDDLKYTDISSTITGHP